MYEFWLTMIKRLEYEVPIEFTNRFGISLPSLFFPYGLSIFVDTILSKRVRSFDENGKVIILSIPSSEKKNWERLKNFGEALVENSPKNCIASCWLKRIIYPETTEVAIDFQELRSDHQYLKELGDDHKQFLYGLLVVFIAEELIKTLEEELVKMRE